MSVLVLVPARGGSKGLPGKNLRTVAGISLVGHALRAGREFLHGTQLKGSVCLDTDSEEIADEGKRWGADIPFLREPELAEDGTSTIDSVLGFVERLEGMGRKHDDVVLLQPTSPLRTAADITECFRAYDRSFGSLVAVVALNHPAEQTVRLSEDKVIAWAWPESGPTQRRQALPIGYRPSGAVYISSVRSLREHRSFFVAGQTRGVELPAERSIDIDSARDLAAADSLARNSNGSSIAVAARQIGAGHPCYVIAEAGVNHNGSAEMAHRLIDAAADAGADAVKFQTFEPAKLVSTRAPMADYQVHNTGQRRTQAEMLAELVLPKSLYVALREHARARNVEFLSTPFDEASADFLESLDISAFKIPSGELTNHPFLAHVARKRRPMLVSTGMADIAEVSAALSVIRRNGDPPVALFHCVTSYPAPIADSNLRAIETLRAAFGCPSGWSDHTLGITTAIASVAMGAALLEKHFTLDRALPGPDHAASLLPDELAQMVRAIRDVERARGDGQKEPRPIEKPLRLVARKSLHAARDLRPGDSLQSQDLVALRPGTGLAPFEAERLLGRKLAVSRAAGELIEEAHLSSPLDVR